MVDCLLSMPEAPGPMPSTENKKSDLGYQMSWHISLFEILHLDCLPYTNWVAIHQINVSGVKSPGL